MRLNNLRNLVLSMPMAFRMSSRILSSCKRRSVMGNRGGGSFFDSRHLETRFVVSRCILIDNSWRDGLSSQMLKYRDKPE